MDKKIVDSIISIIQESIHLKQAIIDEKIGDILKTTDMILEALRDGKKVLFFGNGGSAADAQHLAAEFVNRFLFDRPALPAIALTTDTSVLSSIANDFDFRFIFSRQIEALGQEGDVAIGISTSGSSPNVIEGLKKAKEKGLRTIALVGNKIGDLLDQTDIIISVPSTSTPRIQEAHIMLGHIICQVVEEQIFRESSMENPYE